METEGQSLIDGLENLVTDLEANNGELVVRLADESAFELGGNIATTPGDVVYRNRMMELIQYKPATETVHETPIVLFPPWINKFYILDLKAQNSLIKWVTEQGYTLFVVSWVNADASHAEVGMEDYIQEGFLTAIDKAKEICKVKQVNAVGYCIAGTTLSLTLVAAETARRQIGEIGDLLYYAHRFRRPGRVHAVPAERFRRRDRGAGGRGGAAALLGDCADHVVPSLQGPDLWPGGQKLHDGGDAACL